MRRIARWATIVIVAGVCVWLLTAHSTSWLQMLQPGFLVVEVRGTDRTMVLQRANRRYIVRCEERCGNFLAGKKYRMRNRGGTLEYRKRGETIVLPIVEEQIFFPTQPGGVG
jgi:hypothetical protein